MLNKALLYAAIAMAFVVANTGCSPGDSYFRERTVKLLGPQGLCSGEQVEAPSGVSYILTAGHCADLAVNGQILVETEDGYKIQRRVIAEDANSDLLLIEGLPNLRGLQIAARVSRSIKTFTHGKGLDTYKTEGQFIQTQRIQVALRMINSDEDLKSCESKAKQKVAEIPVFFGLASMTVCVLDVEESVTTAMTVPGSSGGMAVDSAGELIGVVSAGDGTFSYFVRLSDIQRFIKGY